MDPLVVDSPEAVTEVVSWYAPSLGLADWSFECRWNAVTDNDSQAECHRDPCHRSAVITVNDSAKYVHQRQWAKFHDPEASAIHELIHVAMVDYEQQVERAIAFIPDGDLKATIVADVEKYHERFVNAMSFALKSTAYADRDGPPPSYTRVFAGSRG